MKDICKMGGALLLIILVVLLAILIASTVVRCLLPASGGVFGGGPFRLKVSDPEYTALLEGKKTVEARLDRPPFSRLAVGDPVIVVRSRPKGDTSEYPGGKYKHEAEVVRVEKYKGIEALLKGEGLAKVYPGKSLAEATARFSMYLPPGATATDPVIAIELRAASEAGSKKKAAKKESARLSSRFVSEFGSGPDSEELGSGPDSEYDRDDELVYGF